MICSDNKKIVLCFGHFMKNVTFAVTNKKCHAEIAQLVEHNLAKVRVASSSLVFRSRKSPGGGKVRVSRGMQVRVLFWARVH